MSYTGECTNSHGSGKKTRSSSKKVKSGQGKVVPATVDPTKEVGGKSQKAKSTVSFDWDTDYEHRSPSFAPIPSSTRSPSTNVAINRRRRPDAIAQAPYANVPGSSKSPVWSNSPIYGVLGSYAKSPTFAKSPTQVKTIENGFGPLYASWPQRDKSGRLVSFPVPYFPGNPGELGDMAKAFNAKAETWFKDTTKSILKPQDPAEKGGLDVMAQAFRASPNVGTEDQGWGKALLPSNVGTPMRDAHNPSDNADLLIVRELSSIQQFSASQLSPNNLPPWFYWLLYYASWSPRLSCLSRLLRKFRRYRLRTCRTRSRPS